MSFLASFAGLSIPLSEYYSYFLFNLFIISFSVYFFYYPLLLQHQHFCKSLVNSSPGYTRFRILILNILVSMSVSSIPGSRKLPGSSSKFNFHSFFANRGFYWPWHIGICLLCSSFIDIFEVFCRPCWRPVSTKIWQEFIFLWGMSGTMYHKAFAC